MRILFCFFLFFIVSGCEDNFENANVEEINKVNQLRDAAIKYMADPEKALDYANEMLELAKAIGLTEEIGNAYNIIGGINRRQNNYVEALKYYQQSAEAFELAKDTVGMGKVYNNIGNIYRDISKFENALFFYQRALTAKTLVRDRSGIAVTNRNMAFVYQLLGDYEKAKDSYWTSLYTWKALKNEERMAQLYNDLGVVYDLYLDNNEAVNYNVEKNIIYNLHLNSLELNKRIHNQRGVGWAFNNIGISLVEKREFEDALTYFMQALKLKKSINDQEGLGATYNNIGGVYLSQEGKEDLALTYFDLAEQYAKGEELKKTYEYSITAFEKQGKFSLANSYLKKLEVLNAQLLEIKHREELAKIEARYAVEYAGL